MSRWDVIATYRDGRERRVRYASRTYIAAWNHALRWAKQWERLVGLTVHEIIL